MATVPQKTLNWLWGALQREYRDPPRAYADIAQVLAQYPGFAPRTDVYTAENGTSALLLHLNGTVPVNFRGSQYRFPVAIRVPHAYPHEAPILYVAPTDDMMIRPGQHVSPSDGRIYHPYLARWKEGWERSTIADFLNLLTEVFAREPPVMSRQQQPPVQAYQQLPPRPPPLSESRPPSGAYQSATTGAPPPPPEPTDQSNGSRSPFLQREPLRQGRYDAPPPLPGQAPSPRPASMSLPLSQGYPPHIQYQPQRQSSLRQGYPNEQQPPSNMQNQPQRQPTLGSPSPNQSRTQPVARRAPPPTIQSLYQQTQPQYFAQPPPQHQYPLQDMQPNRQIQQASYQQQAQLPKPKPQEPNLMDASPFDVTLPRANTAHLPTPVIPPNPEKQHILQSLQSALLSNLQSQISQSTSAVAPLQSQYSALKAAQQNLQQELNQLQTLQSQLQQNISSLTSTISSADRTIGSARNESSPSKIPNIDELIIAPTVVARQLYDNVAEQRGYEAAIYALTEGFVRGRIGGELWARKTRECAREEFRRKWLVRRIGRGMALDMSQMEG